MSNNTSTPSTSTSSSASRVNLYKVARSYFQPKNINGSLFINAGKAQNLIRGFSDIDRKASIPSIVMHLQLEHKILMKAKNMAIVPNASVSDNYKCRQHAVYINYEQLLAFKGLADRIAAEYETDPACLDDIAEQLSNDQVAVSIEVKPEVPQKDSIEENPNPTHRNVQPQATLKIATMLYYNGEAQPILTLNDDERFSYKDQIFDLEVRGQKKVDKILFKVEDIATMFEMGRLSNILEMIETYVLDQHYVVLSSDPSLQLCCKVHSNDHSYDLTNYGSNQNIYLTWHGLLKVLFASKSGNHMREYMTTWVVNTMFIHQYGNDEERSILATNLVKSYRPFINSKSGVYLIRIGKVSTLHKHGQMSINGSPYENHSGSIYKFGRSCDLIQRFTEHAAKTGYGCYSETITPEIFAFISEDHVNECENVLKAYVDQHHLRFKFTDSMGKVHNELVILTNVELKAFKERYYEILTIYGTKSDNQLNNMITSLKHSNELITLKLNNEIVLLRSDNRVLTEQLASSEREKNLTNENSALKIQLLEMQLASLTAAK